MQIADEILGSDDPVNSTLYKSYSKNFRKGIDQVYHSGGGEELKANVSRFAAYKAYQATQLARRERVDKETGETFDQKKAAKATLAQFQAWQQAEYNTTVARARTAKQWELYSQPNRVRLFPNIKWLPSTSVERRPEHIAFYGRIWAKDDPFWESNTPGTLWNCKCGMQETNDGSTENSDVPEAIPPRGLEGNPAMTGEIFTNNASYFQFKNNGAAQKAESGISELQRDVAKERVDAIKKDTATVSIDNKKQEVVFDGTTKNHISDDIKKTKNWLWLETIEQFPDLIERSKLVAYENNSKLDKKPSALKYWYFECTIGKKTFYFNIEENYVIQEDRHFFRLYSLTKNLRNSVTRI